MPTIRPHRFIAATFAPLLLVACGGASEPEAEEPAVIDERQANFEAMSDAFKALRGQLEGETPDFVAMEASAREINERAQRIAGFFPEGTGMDDGFDSEALASIWQEPAEFETAAQNLVDASEQLVGAVQSADAAAVAAQAKELGGNCKACHDQFRLDDD